MAQYYFIIVIDNFPWGWLSRSGARSGRGDGGRGAAAGLGMARVTMVSALVAALACSAGVGPVVAESGGLRRLMDGHMGNMTIDANMTMGANMTDTGAADYLDGMMDDSPSDGGMASADDAGDHEDHDDHDELEGHEGHDDGDSGGDDGDSGGDDGDSGGDDGAGEDGGGDAD